MSEVVVNTKDVSRLEQRCDSLQQERDTFIACLRECVVALEGIEAHKHLSVFSCPCPCLARKALTLAKSTLSKYEW